LFDESDVVPLTETHLFPAETPLNMPGFQCLHNPRPVFDMSSVRAAVKHNGGVAVFVNDSWSNCVSLWKQSTDGTRLWLQFQCSGAALLFLAIVYAPPKGSPYVNEGLFDNIAAEVGMIQGLGGSILFVGDFNARTSAADDYVDYRYFAEHMPNTLPLGNDFPEVLPKRHNSDKGGLKGWHNEFLDLCSSSGLFILNGRITGDESGECTCLANGGSTLWIIWSHHLLCLIVPHHLWYIHALYSVEKGVIPTTCHFHSTCNYLGNMCHQQFQTLVQTSVVSNMMLASAHSIVNTCNNKLPNAQHR
jgi:hypothetical protein